MKVLRDWLMYLSGNEDMRTDSVSYPERKLMDDDSHSSFIILHVLDIDRFPLASEHTGSRQSLILSES